MVRYKIGNNINNKIDEFIDTKAFELLTSIFSTIDSIINGTIYSFWIVLSLILSLIGFIGIILLGFDLITLLWKIIL